MGGGRHRARRWPGRIIAGDMAPSPTAVRRRRRRAAALVCAGSGAALLAAVRTGAPVPTAGRPQPVEADCITQLITPVCVPTATAPTPSGPASQSPTSHPPPPPRGTSPSTGSAAPGPRTPPAFSPPPPPLPSASAGSPPVPPRLAVQSIVLTASDGDVAAPGSTVVVEVTCEATRGTDVYSVPHVPLSFTVTGSGAGVDPGSGDSGDLGAVLVTVRTATSGDTVLTASAGAVSGSLTIHPGATPASTPRSQGGGAGTVPPGSGGVGIGRVLVATGLVLLAGGGLLALRMRRGRRARRRRRSWGRRSS